MVDSKHFLCWLFQTLNVHGASPAHTVQQKGNKGQGYPPQQYPPGAGYPPQQGGYPPQAGYPPQQGGYPPQQGGYPPQQGGYPPQGYPPQGAPGGYPPQGGYPGAYNPNRPYGKPGKVPGGKDGKNKKDKDKKKKKDKTNPAAHQGTWYSQYYQQISPQELPALQAWFQQNDKDHSGEISAAELGQCEFPGGVKLDAETAKKVVRVFDTDMSGTMSFYEYAALHKFIVHLQAAFYRSDTDRSNTLEPTEIGHALAAAGFQGIDDYSIRPFLKKIQATNQYSITFQSFVALCVQLRHFQAIFQKWDPRNTGTVTLRLPEFLKIMASQTV